MIILGIDPGNNGAFAFLGPPGELLNIEDMPTDKIEGAVGSVSRGRRKAAGKKSSTKTVRNVISAQAIWDLLDGCDGSNTVAFMEKLVGMPSSIDPKTGVRRQMGAASMLSFGRGGGLIEMALCAKGISLTLVPAATWKKAVSCPTGKDGARARATQQFPLWAEQFKLKKNDGVAEAAMIALYGARIVSGKL
jgi:hypothetical protein